MHRRPISASILALPFILASAGCGSSEPTSPPEGDQPPLGVITLTAETLPPCGESNKRVVYYIKDTDTFKFCNGTKYVVVDMQGLDGTSFAVQTVDAAGECPAGGVTLLAGPDENRDGVIDGAPTSTATICNGTSCTVADNGDGTSTLSCEDGSSVVISSGEDENLLEVTPEPPGPSCACGGNLILTGDDQDADGVLDMNEITDTAHACAPCRGALAVATGYQHSCALLHDHRVKCWGYGNPGLLGLGDSRSRGTGPGEMGSDLPSVPLSSQASVAAVAVGGVHTCALLDDGGVKCWGHNSGGQLGLGDTASRGNNAGQMGDSLPAVALGMGRRARAVDAGDGHACALLDDDEVKCWGMGAYGQLGLDEATNRGDDPNEMGDNLPSVNLGSGRTALAIATGGQHTCALLDNHKVKCWGDNYTGQLGLGDTNTRGDEAGEMGSLVPVPLGAGRTALAVTAGTNHTCALLDNHKVKCWGGNGFGQLGLGNTANLGDGPGEMGDSLPFVNLGSGRTALSIDAGTQHTCALLDDGRVKCWGDNTLGALGLGDQDHRGDSPNEMGGSLPPVDLGTGLSALSVAAGADHSCALFNDGRIKCWGDNFIGQLGLGDNLNRGDAAGELGNLLPFVELF